MSNEESMADSSRREGAFLSTLPKHKGETFGKICSNLSWERESISLRDWLCATGWIQVGAGGPVKEVPSEFATGRKFPSGNPWADMERASSLPSLNSDGYKSQDVSLSLPAFHGHKLHSLGLCCVTVDKLWFPLGISKREIPFSQCTARSMAD